MTIMLLLSVVILINKKIIKRLSNELDCRVISGQL